MRLHAYAIEVLHLTPETVVSIGVQAVVHPLFFCLILHFIQSPPRTNSVILKKGLPFFSTSARLHSQHVDTFEWRQNIILSTLTAAVYT